MLCCKLIRKSLRTGVSYRQISDLVCKGKGGEGSHGDGAEGSASGSGAALGIATIAAAVRGAAVAARAAAGVVAGFLAGGDTVAKIRVGGAGGSTPLGARAVKARSLTGAVLDELLGLLGNLREVVGGERPVVALGGAVKVVLTGLGTCRTGRGGVGLELSGETVEVFVGLGTVIAKLDNTVSVGLDGEFVCKTTRVDGGHVLTHESLDLVPVTTVGDAAELREEDWERVVAVEFDLFVPARLLEVRGVTPGVVVEGEEVAAGVVVITAREVDGLLVNVLLDISGGVSDRDGAVSLSTNVALHVAGDGLDVGGSVGVVPGVDNLVTREENEEVVLLTCQLILSMVNGWFVTHCSLRMHQWWRKGAASTRRCKTGGESPGSRD